MQYNTCELLGVDGPYMPEIKPDPSFDWKRYAEIKKQLDTLYAKGLQPGLSSREQRNIDKMITELECELDGILGNQAQGYTPGGYYTPGGIKPATGAVVVDQAALVLGDKDAGDKKKFPWWLLLLAAGGTATYFSVKG